MSSPILFFLKRHKFQAGGSGGGGANLFLTSSLETIVFSKKSTYLTYNYLGHNLTETTSIKHVKAAIPKNALVGRH